MIGIIIVIVFLIAICQFGFKKYKEISELKALRDECVSSLENALESRYKVMEELINFSRGFLEDENKSIIKLLEAKLIPIEERYKVERELVTELKRLFAFASDTPQLKGEKEFSDLVMKLAKSEKIIFECKNDLNKRTKEYNELIYKFPTKIIAILAGFKMKYACDITFVTR